MGTVTAMARARPRDRVEVSPSKRWPLDAAFPTATPEALGSQLPRAAANTHAPQGKVGGHLNTPHGLRTLGAPDEVAGRLAHPAPLAPDKQQSFW